MRNVKINFRIKHDRGIVRSWKVYTTQRIQKAKKPIQIHIGYIPESFPISDNIKNKIENKLKEKWIKHYNNEEVCINWEDANRKFKDKLDNTDKRDLQIISRTKSRNEALILYTISKSFIGNAFHKPFEEDLSSLKNFIDYISFASGFSRESVSQHAKTLLDKKFIELFEETTVGRHYYVPTDEGLKYIKENYEEFLPY